MLRADEQVSQKLARQFSIERSSIGKTTQEKQPRKAHLTIAVGWELENAHQ